MSAFYRSQRKSSLCFLTVAFAVLVTSHETWHFFENCSPYHLRFLDRQKIMAKKLTMC